jgi:inosose dehydratase
MAMFDPNKVHLACLPTCWINDDFPSIGEGTSYQQIMSEIALAGFEGCSVSHTFPKDIPTLKAELALRGLRISEPWVSLYFTLEDMHDLTVEAFRRQVEFIGELGGSLIVVAEFGHSVHLMPDVVVMANRPRFDDEQWSRLAEGLNEVGTIAADAGLTLCYHHHMGTGVQSRADVDRLMAATDPAVVHLLLDCAHLTWAGDDPLELARAHVDRIRHVHLKSVRAQIIKEATENRWSFFQGVLAGAFTVPGDGDIDFRPILEVLAAQGYEGWLSVEAEQDPAKANPLEHAVMARSYLRDVLGF